MVAPGPPSNIKVDFISSYELNVSWDLPAEANWVITRYEVAIYEKEKENINETHDTKLEKSRLFNELDIHRTWWKCQHQPKQEEEISQILQWHGHIQNVRLT